MTSLNDPDMPNDRDDMDEREWLVQRFVDHDLSPQERIDFLKAMDRDPTIRKQVLVTEQMLLHSARLPRMAVPPGFKEEILKQLAPASANQAWWEPVWAVLFAPRVLQWNPAMALAAACLLIGMLWVVKQPMIPSGPEMTPSHSVMKASVLEGVDKPVMVRLVMLEPQARSVAVAGDFNGWQPQKTPLQRTDDGAWTVTLKVKPGRYHYMFVVDGQEWITDPFAGEYSSDGFGAKNAVLDVSHAL